MLCIIVIDNRPVNAKYPSSETFLSLLIIRRAQPMQEKHEPLGVHGALPGAPNGPPCPEPVEWPPPDQSAIHRDSVRTESPAQSTGIWCNPISGAMSFLPVRELTGV